MKAGRWAIPFPTHFRYAERRQARKYSAAPTTSVHAVSTTKIEVVSLPLMTRFAVAHAMMTKSPPANQNVLTPRNGNCFRVAVAAKKDRCDQEQNRIHVRPVHRLVPPIQRMPKPSFRPTSIQHRYMLVARQGPAAPLLDAASRPLSAPSPHFSVFTEKGRGLLPAPAFMCSSEPGALGPVPCFFSTYPPCRHRPASLASSPSPPGSRTREPRW
jgi:hypothetical protein